LREGTEVDEVVAEIVALGPVAVEDEEVGLIAHLDRLERAFGRAGDIGLGLPGGEPGIVRAHIDAEDETHPRRLLGEIAVGLREGPDRAWPRLAGAVGRAAADADRERPAAMGVQIGEEPAVDRVGADRRVANHQLGLTPFVREAEEPGRDRGAWIVGLNRYSGDNFAGRLRSRHFLSGECARPGLSHAPLSGRHDLCAFHSL
jgi:hypothetical protein